MLFESVQSDWNIKKNIYISEIKSYGVMTSCILVKVHRCFTKTSCLHAITRRHTTEDVNPYSHRHTRLKFHKREFPSPIYVVITEVSKLHISFHGLCFPRSSGVLSHHDAAVFRLQGPGNGNHSISRTDLLPCYVTATGSQFGEVKQV
jgi:hypothetical protein